MNFGNMEAQQRKNHLIELYNSDSNKEQNTIKLLYKILHHHLELKSNELIAKDK